MHLYRENCIFDLPNCISYENGFHCKECSNGFEVEESTKKCIKQKDHTDVILDVDNIDPSDEMGTAFMVSNDLVKSIHT